MRFVKKYWYFTIITIITLGLGVITFITSQQLTKTTPVAPTVPQVTPKAAEQACTLTLNIVSPTTTLTGTPGDTPTNTPTNTPTPAGELKNCNGTCTVNADCTSGLVCTNSACRNASCTDKSDCICNQSESSPTPTTLALSGCNIGCTVNMDCSNGLVCIDNFCRNASCTEKTNCSCEEVAAVPTPKTPVAGTGPTVLGATIIGSAFLLILLGLAL
jgi:hypothetical protein